MSYYEIRATPSLGCVSVFDRDGEVVAQFYDVRQDDGTLSGAKQDAEMFIAAKNSKFESVTFHGNGRKAVNVDLETMDEYVKEVDDSPAAEEPPARSE